MKFQTNKSTTVTPLTPEEARGVDGAIKWSDVTEEQAREWVLGKDKGAQWSPSSRHTFWTTYGKKNGFYFECGNAKTAILQIFYEKDIPFSQKDNYILVETL